MKIERPKPEPTKPTPEMKIEQPKPELTKPTPEMKIERPKPEPRNFAPAGNNPPKAGGPQGSPRAASPNAPVAVRASRPARGKLTRDAAANSAVTNLKTRPSAASWMACFAATKTRAGGERAFTIIVMTRLGAR